MAEKSRIGKFEQCVIREFGSFELRELTRPLADMGFFTAPSSRKYHGSYEGGLFDHSFMVMRYLVDLTNRNDLKWERGRISPFIVGMFHDLCKADSYVYIPNDAGKGHYEHNNDTLITGHGDKSVMLLSSLIKLTMEEVACIRYHMGAFTDKEEWRSYTRAVKQYPNVLWTHHADMLAAHVEGV